MDSTRAPDSIGSIAIVGMSGRFPGARNLDEFWRNLCDGVESVSFFPDAELANSGIDPSLYGRANYVPAAAVLDDIEQFDAGFFGCSPKEAQTLDPQHRMFLECAWEALEDAGIAPGASPGEIGVYAGANVSHYLLFNLLPRRAGSGFVEDFQTLIGNAKDYLATRTSYKLNLTGPSLSVQTACSTSLVAVSLACQSLLSYQCDAALAGGVTVRVPQKAGYLYEPGGILSPDGHCRPFDAGAQGTLLGNGLGIVVLKRLEDAIADHSRIHAVIRGWAVNNDGSQKIGYTAPGVDGQAKVIAMAQAVAGVKPETISYIEAHGTGTELGDPIEIEALTRVFRASTAAKSFCALGSIKSNLGHLEAAAGIAALIKTVLALKHKRLPPSLHFDRANPRIDLANSPFYVNSRLSDWKEGASRRRAGVSSFGIGGTNAHVVLEAAPARPSARDTTARTADLLTLSAKTEAALQELAAKYANHLAETGDSLADVCFTANTGRSHFPWRAAAVADSRSEAGVLLGRFAGGERPSGVLHDHSGNPAPKLAFVFSGQGSQFAGMGRQLYETSPLFRKELDRCDRLLHGQLEHDLLPVLYPKNNASSPIHQTAYTQPALFALEYCLAKLWQSWGVQPALVMGHSVGEYAAACFAGVLSLEDALRLVAQRSCLMQRLPQDGAMVAVFADEHEVAKAAAAHAGHVSIAAVNAPDNVVISGARDRVQEIAAQFDARQVRTQALAVSHAFHSPLMRPMLPALERAAAGLQYGKPQIGLVSCVTGAVAADGELSDANYWVRHAREPVRFAAGLRALHDAGCDTFLEIGPSATLLALGRRCLPEARAVWLPSLREGRPDWRQMLESLASLYVRGLDIDWRAFDRDYHRNLVTAPTYPFQRQRYWVDAPAAESRKQVSATGSTARTHPLLGCRLSSPLREVQFELEAGPQSIPFIDDHRVYGTPVVPAAAYLEMVHAAVVEALHPGDTRAVCIMEDLLIRAPMRFEGGTGSRMMQVIVSPDGAARAAVRICSLAAGTGVWTDHVTCQVSMAPMPPDPMPVDRVQVQAGCPDVSADVDAFYEAIAERGLGLGPSLRWIEQIGRKDGEAIARFRPMNDQEQRAGYRIHPGLLDSCFQLVAAALPAGARDSLYMPVEVKTVRYYGAGEGHTWGRAILRPGEGSSSAAILADLELFDDHGRVLAQVEGLVARRAAREALAPGGERAADMLYRVEWQPQPRAAEQVSAEFLPGVKDVAGRLHPLLESLAAEHDLARYAGLMEQLDALAGAYAVEALRELGCEFLPGPFVPPAAPQQQRLLDQVLALLEAGGILRCIGGAWKVARAPEREDPHHRSETLQTDYPVFGAELALLENWGRLLPKLLRGECSPLEVLLPGRSFDTLEKLYRDSPVSRVTNGLVRAAVAQVLRSLPDKRTLRVLEIGAGTGGTTAYLLPELGGHAVEYVFTDVSPQFISAAERKFGEYAFIDYRLLDIEQDPAAQGFERERFDIVVAAHVLHATRDLRRTLAHVRTLLSPGGMVLLVEGTGPQRSLDLVFGVTEGWWKFTDRDLRPDHPLMPQDKWVALLQSIGFTEAAAVPEARQDAPSQPALIMARCPAASPENIAIPDDDNWLIFADRSGSGQALAHALNRRGAAATLVFAGSTLAESGDGSWTANPASPSDFQQLLRLHEGARRFRRVVHLWSLDTPENPGALAQAQALNCGSVLHLVQALADGPGPNPPQLSLITRGAQAVEPEPASVSPAQAALWGLCRVVANEHPALRCLSVDLDAADDTAVIDALIDEISGAGEENEVAFRGRARYVPRVVGESRQPAAQGRLERPAGQPFQLQIGSPGTLDSLVLRPVEPPVPGPGEVQIRVRATGLNFRDVLHALGVYPGGSGPIGIECAGVITAIAEDLEGLHIGDEVIALATGSFASLVVARADLVAPKPPDLSYEEGASIPIVFLTAYHALHNLGKIATGERVLIHAATGGVGLAAVQLAQRAGAEIFATAGSPEKRDYLRRLGIPHVLNSRSVDFAGEVLSLTRGEGVDVVLNSLSGEFIPRSLSILRPGGRFLEIGKAGIWTESQVAEFRRDVSYFEIALDQSIADRSPAIGDMFRGLIREFERGSLKPLPRRVYAIEDARGAFRYMAQARHIGKIVLTTDERPPESQPPLALRSDATYWITGGLGGLGLLMARWMVERGARNLVLMGRNAPGADARKAIGSLEAAGARVLVTAGDVSREEDVAKALALIRTDLPPLAGILHCAGVLDDGVLIRQEWSRFSRVLEPKAGGAWNLHVLTQSIPLDFFVLFSSAAALLGPPGQGSHAAANAFLDGLAHYRRAGGLPALSINWGGWAEVGAAARHVLQLRAGLRPIAPRHGLEAFECAIQRGCVQVLVVPVDRDEFSRQARDRKIPPLWSSLVEHSLLRPAGPHPVAEPAALARRLREAPASERRSLLLDELRHHASRVLALDPSALDIRQPLNEMGLDSLMAIELRNTLAGALGRSLPATLLFDYPTVESLAAYVAREWFGATTAAADPPRDSDESGTEALAGVPDDEIAALLAGKLDSLESELLP